MRWLMGFLGALVVLVFVLFLVRQTADVVALASTLHPGLGRVVLIALLLAYLGCLAVPWQSPPPTALPEAFAPLYTCQPYSTAS